MKSFVSIVLVVGMLSVVGCGKTLAELRSDGDAIVDNGTQAVNGIIGTVSTVLKKLISAGVAVYDVVKKAGEDIEDDVIIVKDTVTGSSTTPPAP